MYKFTDKTVNRLKHHLNDSYALRKNRKARVCIDCRRTIDKGEYAVELLYDTLFKMSGYRNCVECATAQGIIEVA